MSHCIFLQFTLSEIIYLTCVLVMFFDCMCPSVYLSGCLRVKIAYRKTIFGIFRRFLFFIFSIASQAMSLLVPKKFVFCSYPFPTLCPLEFEIMVNIEKRKTLHRQRRDEKGFKIFVNSLEIHTCLYTHICHIHGS